MTQQKTLTPQIGDTVVYTDRQGFRVLGEVSTLFTSATGNACLTVTEDVIAKKVADVCVWWKNTGPSGPNVEGLPATTHKDTRP